MYLSSLRLLSGMWMEWLEPKQPFCTTRSNSYNESEGREMEEAELLVNVEQPHHPGLLLCGK